jgi:hypothetical protein
MPGTDLIVLADSGRGDQAEGPGPDIDGFCITTAFLERSMASVSTSPLLARMISMRDERRIVGRDGSGGDARVSEPLRRGSGPVEGGRFVDAKMLRQSRLGDGIGNCGGPGRGAGGEPRSSCGDGGDIDGR